MGLRSRALRARVELRSKNMKLRIFVSLAVILVNYGINEKESEHVYS